MTTTLNATTSNGLVVTPDNSGNILLQYNGVAAPAFSAYPSTGQTVSATTWTKITLGTEIFDTNSNFSSSRFTPTVAGYYQINGRVGNNGGATEVISAIYKNGSAYAYGADYNSGYISTVCDVVYLNGSTDYVELYGFIGGQTAVSAAQERTLFSGVLVRGA